MQRNVASQVVGTQMTSASDGSAFTSAVTCYVTKDGGAQAIGSVGSGICTHEGNGFHTYLPSQEETNAAHVAFTFIGSGARPSTEQVYTTTAITDIDQEAVPANRTFVLVDGDDGLEAASKSIAVDTAPTVYAVDFRNDMPANGRIASVGTPVMISGDAEGLTFGATGRDHTLAKIEITAVTVGVYRFRVLVTYSTGATARGMVTINVVE